MVSRPEIFTGGGIGFSNPHGFLSSSSGCFSAMSKIDLLDVAGFGIFHIYFEFFLIPAHGFV